MKHLALIGASVALLAACMCYPFLPGRYDALAVALSIMAQMFGVVGLLLVPIGVLWLSCEWFSPRKDKRRLFAIASLIAASFVAALVSLVGVAISGPALGLLALALWLFIAARLLSRLKAMRNAPPAGLSVAPFYLLLLPTSALLLQLVLAAPLTASSRNRAMASSAALIKDIEAYRAAHGAYAKSLLATWKDYEASVVGIDGFHDAPNGEAYNLFFEQPRFLLDDFGTREFVVYNPLDEQTMISHASWLLLVPPEKLKTRQGWYTFHDAAIRHWKCFLFD